jgi:hypothetical protein
VILLRKGNKMENIKNKIISVINFSIDRSLSDIDTIKKSFDYFYNEIYKEKEITSNIGIFLLNVDKISKANYCIYLCRTLKKQIIYLKTEKEIFDKLSNFKEYLNKNLINNPCRLNSTDPLHNLTVMWKREMDAFLIGHIDSLLTLQQEKT